MVERALLMFDHLHDLRSWLSSAPTLLLTRSCLVQRDHIVRRPECLASVCFPFFASTSANAVRERPVLCLVCALLNLIPENPKLRPSDGPHRSDMRPGVGLALDPFGPQKTRLGSNRVLLYSTVGMVKCNRKRAVLAAATWV